MEKNVGGLDRLVRVVLGLALLSLFIFLPAPANWLGLIGIVPLATAALRWCPAYRLIGLNTCPRR